MKLRVSRKHYQAARMLPWGIYAFLGLSMLLALTIGKFYLLPLGTAFVLILVESGMKTELLKCPHCRCNLLKNPRGFVSMSNIMKYCPDCGKEIEIEFE